MNACTFRLAIIAGAALAFALPSPLCAEEKKNSCIDCHSDTKFLVQNKKLYDYYKKWTTSSHFHADVKCQDCHGGNPEKSSKDEAHGSGAAREASDPKSKTNFRNIPETCKKCHKEIYDAYKTSNHFEKLKEKAFGANCVTCHGSVNIEVLTANTVKDTCKQCHNKQTKNAPEVPAKATELLNKYLACNRLYRWVAKHKDSAASGIVPADLEARTKDLVRGWHTFDLDKVRNNVEALLVDLKKARASLLSETSPALDSEEH